jgi:hypothetical protein
MQMVPLSIHQAKLIGLHNLHHSVLSFVVAPVDPVDEKPRKCG